MSVPSNREEGETGDTVPEPNESSVSIRSLLNPAEPSPSPTAAAAAGSVSVSVSASSGVVHPSIVDLQVPFDTTGRPLTPDSQEGTDAGDDAAIHPSNPYLSVRTAPLLVPLAVPPDASQGRDNPSGDQLDQGPVSDAAPGLLPAAPIFTGDGTLESELREEELSDYQRYLYDSLHLVPDQHPYDSSSDSQSQGRISTGHTIVEPDAVHEEGRTYHGYREGKYLLPNDGEEQDRLDIQHHIWGLLMDSKLAWAPLDGAPANVLDIATGTGAWAIEFARQHAGSHVVGTDLSAIQPGGDAHGVANVSFIKEDSEDAEWLFGTPFDYVHVRMTLTCFRDPRVVVRKAFDNLVPGGWLEFQDFWPEVSCLDDSRADRRGDALRTYWGKVVEGYAATGIDIMVARSYGAWLAEAGFVDVRSEAIPLPGNPWPDDAKFKHLGRWQQVNQTRILGDRNDGGVVAKVLKAAGMSTDEIADLAVRVKAEIPDRDFHWFWTAYVVYGRKPAAAEREAAPDPGE